MPSCPTANSREGFIRRLFDALSPRYDLFNQLSSLGLDQGWRRRAVEELKLVPGMRVLDLASGTGDLAALAARRLVPLGRVVACDLSLPMLTFARRKFKQLPAARWHIGLAQARAEDLPFPEKTFDAATIGFALRNVTDLDETLRQLHRVLKPGGRLSLLEFGRPKNPLLQAGHRLWLSFGVPALGILTTGKIAPFLYLRRSILGFLEPEEVLNRLRGAGFYSAVATPLQGGTVFLYTAEAPRVCRS